MGQTPDDIVHDIEEARQRLSVDLDRLEHRARQALDWRTYFDRNPWLFVGAAFGAAFIVGWLMARPVAVAPPPNRRRLW